MLLGIDIGGTTISFGLVEGNAIVKKTCVPSFRPKATLDETLAWLYTNIDDVITPEVTSIGVGVPTLVNAQTGTVYDAANIPSWVEVPLKELLEYRYNIPAFVNNDANCYALGAAAQLGFKHKVLCCITLGTGTGVGIVEGDHIFSGVNCGAGEICSLPYNGKDYESFCSKQFFTSKGLSPRKLAEKAAAGDEVSYAMYREFGRHLGELLTVVLYTYDPSCIVLGGGVAHGAPYFQQSMMETLRERYVYKRFLPNLSIEIMPESDLAILGASLLK